MPAQPKKFGVTVMVAICVVAVVFCATKFGTKLIPAEIGEELK